MHLFIIAALSFFGLFSGLIFSALLYFVITHFNPKHAQIINDGDDRIFAMTATSHSWTWPSQKVSWREWLYYKWPNEHIKPESTLVDMIPYNLLVEKKRFFGIMQTQITQWRKLQSFTVTI